MATREDLDSESESDKNDADEDAKVAVGLVDGLEHNLLSISQFCDNCYDVMFEKTICTIINKDKNSIVFKGKRIENVYKINFSELVDQKVICLISVNDNKWMWHRRLGHAN